LEAINNDENLAFQVKTKFDLENKSDFLESFTNLYKKPKYSLTNDLNLFFKNNCYNRFNIVRAKTSKILKIYNNIKSKINFSSVPLLSKCYQRKQSQI
jgi:hypothetical protein